MDVCARVVDVVVVVGVPCREKPLARQFSPDLFTESSSSSSSSSSSPSLGVLEVVKGVVRSPSSSEEAVVNEEGRLGLKRKGREGWSRAGWMDGRTGGRLVLGRWVSLKEVSTKRS